MRIFKDELGHRGINVLRLGASQGFQVTHSIVSNTPAYAHDCVVRVVCTSQGEMHVAIGVNAVADTNSALVSEGSPLYAKVKAGERLSFFHAGQGNSPAPVTATEII